MTGLPFWLTRVGSGSMEPTLRDGQLAWTRALGRGTPVRRGDVVVADSPELGRRVVKRVVGLPGERLEFRSGRVRVDGVPLAEPYAGASPYHGTFHVPPGHYLLLGDNRDASTDSRSWRQPYLRRELLVGRLPRRWRPEGHDARHQGRRARGGTASARPR